jgi:hypothetical protein
MRKEEGLQKTRFRALHSLALPCSASCHARLDTGLSEQDIVGAVVFAIISLTKAISDHEMDF